MKRTRTVETAGFSLAEILVVIGILAVLVATMATAFSGYAYRQQFKSFIASVQFHLIEQQQKSIAAKGDSVHGVYVGTSSIVFFAGTAYTSGASGNQILPIPTTVSATATLSNGANEFYFARITGTSSASGVITLADLKSQSTATITISSTGLVEF